MHVQRIAVTLAIAPEVGLGDAPVPRDVRRVQHDERDRAARLRDAVRGRFAHAVIGEGEIRQPARGAFVDVLERGGAKTPVVLSSRKLAANAFQVAQTLSRLAATGATTQTSPMRK